MSLKTATDGPAYYPVTSTQINQSTMPASSSLDSKRDTNLSKKKINSKKKCSFKGTSVTSSSGSSSNCRYEASSEDPDQSFQELDSSPINVTLTEVNYSGHLKFEPPSSGVKNFWSVTKGLHRVRNENGSIENLPRNLEESESLPIMGNYQLLDRMDQISRDRLVSKSSHARLTKLKTIVADVESMGWSESYEISSQNASIDLTTLYSAKERRKIDKFDSLEAVEIFDKAKGVTFSTLRENNEDPDIDKDGKEKFQEDFTEKSRNRTDENLDRLIDIAENPNPSIKSIYFPPTPAESQVTSDPGTIIKDFKIPKIFPRNRSDALTRIENELGPLQNKFSELTGRVRALNLIGMPYNLMMDSCMESPVRSTISGNTSGYFLHRAEIYHREDSVKDFQIGCGSKFPTAPTVTNLGIFHDSSVKDSCSWYENVETEFPRSLRKLRNADESYFDNKTSILLDDNRFFQDKPYGYGIRYEVPVEPMNFLEKPKCFDNAMSRENRSSRFNGKDWNSGLSSEHLGNLHTHFMEKPTNLQYNDEVYDPNKESRGFDLLDLIDISDKCKDTGLVENDNIDLRKTSEVKKHLNERKIDDRECKKETKLVSSQFEKLKNDQSYSKEKNDSNRETRRKDSNTESFVSMDQIFSQGLQTCRAREIVSSSPISNLSDSLNNSGSLDVGTETSFVSYSQVLPSSRIKLEVCEEIPPNVEQHRIKLMGTFGQRRVLKIDVGFDPKVADSHEAKDGPFAELSNGSVKQKNDSRCLELYENNRSFDPTAERQRRLANNQQKTKILPVNCTDEISKCPSAETEFGFATSEENETRQKVHKGHRGLVKRKAKGNGGGSTSARTTEVFLTSKEASGSFATHLTHFAEECAFVGHEESWHGQWRTGSKLSISYSRSSTSISSKSMSSTINTEKTLTTDVAVSKLKVSGSSKIHDIGNHSSANLELPRSTKRNLDAIQNFSMVTPLEKVSNEEELGIRTLPEDFLYDT